jgi:hypothetical protein
MTYIPLIKVSDFQAYVKLGANVIKGTEMDMSIQDMQELEFNSWCDTPFYEDLMNCNETDRPQLHSLLNTLIKPYLICGAYAKFLLWHGRTINQGGVRSHLSDTDNEISDKARGELMNDVIRKSNIYLNKLKLKLCSDNYTYDGTEYTFYDEIDKKRAYPKTSIRQIGGSNKKYYDKKTGQWL